MTIKSPINRRLSYTICIAVAIHIVVLFSIGFSWATSPKATTSIEVTLAQHQSDTPIEEADFFAQVDQQGSGEAIEKKLLSEQHQISPKDILEDTEPKQANNSEGSTQSNNPKQEAISDFDVIVSLESDLISLQKQLAENPAEQNSSTQESTLSQRIAALNAEINSRKEEMARAPKKRVISTISTKSHQDAEYLENWRRKIVNVGNQHYPKAANEQKIYGRVRLLIAMQAEGTIDSIEILESSGKKILDLSAIKIIKLAAPFEPFSAQMRQNTDILEIIRTIEFEKSTLIY